ncbi:hypothetical protein HanPI659440_Chr01g0021381 [Helianthus annuus]|nr:hypothetical protein HanPI659440_Chr01g0021381 [Helianthus annuus]
MVNYVMKRRRSIYWRNLRRSIFVMVKMVVVHPMLYITVMRSNARTAKSASLLTTKFQGLLSLLVVRLLS